jgi:hypothetical protein
MNSLLKFIKELDTKLTEKINNYNSKYDKNIILTYDRSITTSLLIINILNFLKRK